MACETVDLSIRQFKPPDTVGDAGRVAALVAFDVLDSPPEPEFDDIVQIAATLCDTPIALVSLVSSNRQWFKARVGLEACETSLDKSVCAHGLSQTDLLIIPDLTADPRTCENALVTGDPNNRFYAGAPLVAEGGNVIGMLCVIDQVARPQGLTLRQQSGLTALSRQVMTNLRLRHVALARDEHIRRQDADAERAKALVELGDSVRALQSIDEIARTAATVLGRVLAVNRAGYARSLRRQELIIERDWTSRGVSSLEGQTIGSEFGATLAALRDGRTVAVANCPAAFWLQADAAAYASLGVRALIAAPLIIREHLDGLLFVHCDEPRAWTSEEIAFVHSVADRTYSAIGQAQAESDQRILNEEISHRLKNTLAMVQALASQTLKDVADQEPVRVFGARLQALSGAHEVLLQRAWSSADLASVVSRVLEGVGIANRCDLDGPPLPLGSRAALSISLLAHEMATNALKYGSLSTAQGRVAIRWTVGEVDDHDLLVFSWSERGGRPAREPTRKGFGSRLLRTGLLGTGNAVLSYNHEGFEGKFTASLSQVQQT